MTSRGRRHEGLFESQLQEIGTTGSMRGDFAVLLA
jgi:hypothetical protein